MIIIQQTFIFKQHVGNGVKNVTLMFNEETKEYFIRTQWFNFFTTYIKKEPIEISAGNIKKRALQLFEEQTLWTE